jgi:hypothetical protein
LAAHQHEQAPLDARHALHVRLTHAGVVLVAALVASVVVVGVVVDVVVVGGAGSQAFLVGVGIAAELAREILHAVYRVCYSASGACSRRCRPKANNQQKTCHEGKESRRAKEALRELHAGGARDAMG